MKRIGFICTFILLLAILLLSGCGNGTPSTTTSAETVATTSTQAVTEPTSTQAVTEEQKKVTVIFTDRGTQVSDTLSLYAGTILDPVDYIVASNEEYRYTFLGWDADGDGVPEEFPYTVEKDTVFVAVLEIEHIVYHYNIYVKDELVKSVDGHYGDLIDYPAVSSSVSETETNLFLGWKYNGVYDGLIYNYLTSDVEITAYFAEDQILTLYYENHIFAQYLQAGEPFPALTALGVTAPKGYEVVWYTDQAYKTKADNKMIAGNLTVYGRNEPLDTSDYLRVTTSEELLIAYNDALLARRTTLKLFVDYSYGTLQNLLNFISQNALTLFTQDISIDSSDAYNMTITVAYSPIASFKTNTVLYTQLNTANQTVRASARSDAFDDFAIDKLPNYYVVNNSEALYFVIANGLRPVIDPSNPNLVALYEEMKSVLRSCVDDNMSDVEKARAIYEYLILNTTYDGALANAVQNGENTVGNDSYYLEGVFNDHLAVCDGFSKAYLCLCRMEGIECVLVNGKKVVGDTDHAWNKVNIDGNWYVVDVTSGGTITDNEEVLSYKYFMITDAENEKENRPNANSYTNLICNKTYNVYADINAVAHNVDEAVVLLESFIDAAQGKSTFEMRLDYTITSDEAAIQTILDKLSVQVILAHIGTNGTYCFIYEK